MGLVCVSFCIHMHVQKVPSRGTGVVVFCQLEGVCNQVLMISLCNQLLSLSTLMQRV